jgi:hypothetical protein
VITGSGKVGGGIKEILDAMKIKEVSIENYLTKTMLLFTHRLVLDYNKRIDGKVIDCKDFYKNPTEYVSDLSDLQKYLILLLQGIFMEIMHRYFNQRHAAVKDCKIKSRDVSCDIDGPIACTLRSSTIAEPLVTF